MEELLEVTKKQLKFQKIITACLAVIIVLLVIAGVGMTKRMNEMTAAVEEVVEKVQTIDIDGINDAISSTNQMLESTNKMLENVNANYQAYQEMIEKLKNPNEWFSGILGN